MFVKTAVISYNKVMSQNQGYMIEGRIPSIVQLNVGGKRFTTSLQTLTRDPNSMLAAMFSGRHEVETTEDGFFFIDRDGTYFRFILNYLRNGELILPEGATFLEELEAEARFYQVQGVLDELKTITTLKVLEESVVLTDRYFRNVLIDWIPTEFILAGEWRLLFRASRDGFTASAFHSTCDNKGPTITVVRSGANIFGGFTENAWTSRRGYVSCRHVFLFSFVNPSGLGPTKLSLITGKEGNGIFCNSNYGPLFGGCRGWVSCHQAFLFSFVNPSGLAPTKLPLISGKETSAMFCDPRYGPAFGGIGVDLSLSNGAHSNTNDSYLGSTYRVPPGQPYSFFTGDHKFTVTDYEVFGLRQ